MSSSDNSIPWPKMRGDFRNTGCRIFGWSPQPGSSIRYVDTNAWSPAGSLSLINATPVIGSDETIYVGSSNFIFYACTETGLVYPYRDNNDPNIVDSAACLISDAQLFFPCGNFSLYSLETSPLLSGSSKFINISGNRHWLGDSKVSSPSTIHWLEGNVVNDSRGNLFAGCDNFFLFCCSPTKPGFFQWGFPTGFFIWSACAFSSDQKALYFVSADMTCYALDPSCGAELWERRIGNLSASSPAVTVDNRVIFGAFDGKIYCLNGNDGTIQWVHPTGSLIYASPALSDQDNRIFVTSSDGVLRALDIGGSTPEVVWEFFTGMPSFSSAAIGLDPTAMLSLSPAGLGPDPEEIAPYLVYVGSGNGLLYALDPQGRRRWSYDVAAFYAEKSKEDGPDPAFWPAFRYPAINSSVALGNHGVVTATSGGIVLSIPYDAYQNDVSLFFDKNPNDSYFDHLPETGRRLCYISPAGRMAKQILPRDAGTQITIDAGQTISFAGLSRSSGSPSQRSTFSALPSDSQVLVNGEVYDAWKLSADKTQIHVAPPVPKAQQGSFQLQINDGKGSVLGKVECVYRLLYPSLEPPDLRGRVLTTQYCVQQMSVFSPFIVPALDQLGLATITIPFKFLSIDETSGVAVAYAYESYSGGASGAPTRNLIYTFTGWYVNGNFKLSSGPCYYELTGFPILLDQLTISGKLGHSQKENAGVSLTASYTTTLLKQIEWLFTYLTHWADLGELLPSWKDLWKDLSLEELRKILHDLEKLASGPPTAYTRFATLITRILSGELSEFFGGSSIFEPWKLFDKKDGLFWVGTYALSEVASMLPIKAPEASFSYDAVVGNLQVTVHGCQETDVIGIILLDQSFLPVPLNYTDRNSSPTYKSGNSGETTITQILSLFGAGLDGNARLKAVVMLNLEQVQQTFEFSPGWF